MNTSRTDSIKGIAIAVTIMLLWASHLVAALSTPLISLPAVLIAPMVLLQTFLYTGLFITAHDAMHGSVCRHWRSINHALGMIAVRLYALFSYKKLWRKHWEHHRYVGTPHADPDFHDGEHTSPLCWYAHFMLNYVGWQQIVAMAVVFNVLQYGFGVCLWNALLFWVLPALLSTLQLFIFGTYLPHREPPSGYTNRHRSNPNNWHIVWSFLSCYHFGYHHEHHDSPSTPWWKLPALHKTFVQRSLQ
jgi:beta-carotene ketolase (CrtW type)